MPWGLAAASGTCTGFCNIRVYSSETVGRNRRRARLPPASGRKAVKDTETGLSPCRGILKDIVGRLVEAYSPERIYLFGSAARGDTGPDSDLDIMILVSSDAPKEYRRSRLAYRALRGIGTAVDVLVWTREAFEERLHLRASLPATIVREGRLVYAA
jgi:predicted nucleotidyltransferase